MKHIKHSDTNYFHWITRLERLTKYRTASSLRVIQELRGTEIAEELYLKYEKAIDAMLLIDDLD